MVQSGEGADEMIASYLYYFVQATGVKMVLSGESADELFILFCSGNWSKDGAQW